MTTPDNAPASTPDRLTAQISAYITALMAQCPPLDDDQRSRIAALLVPTNYTTPGRRPRPARRPRRAA